MLKVLIPIGIAIGLIMPAAAGGGFQAFEEICEVTGEMKTTIKWIEYNDSVSYTIVEEISLEDSNSK